MAGADSPQPNEELVAPRAPGRPPSHVWLAFALVAVLQGLPFLITRLNQNPNIAYLPIGYIPKDWLQYTAIIRETAHTGRITFENPFTTAPQSGRFVLLFHALLGQISRWTHVNPFWVLELSRIPLLMLLAYVLWRFLTPILPDLRHRSWACWLIALAGGLDFLVRMCSGILPPVVAERVIRDLWHLSGWNLFASLYNPLWIAALTLALLVFAPLVRPGGPSGLAGALQSALGLVVLYFCHPYTGIAVLTMVGATFVVRFVFGVPHSRAELLRVVLILLPACILIAAINLWQDQDPVYKASSGNVFGDQELPVFWYPLTYGALFVFGLLGWRRWIGASHPWRFALGGWSLAIMFLHSSPLINGYHFVALLYIPLCIVAAPVVSDTFGALWPARRLAALALGLLLFGGNLQLTWTSIEEVQRPYPDGAALHPDYLSVCEQLAIEPDGNVLASPGLSNIIPAYSHDHVFVGHWFMTPLYAQKAELYEKLVRYIDSGERTAASDASLRDFLSSARIRYLVLPTPLLPRAQEILGASVERNVSVGLLVILDLKPPN